MGDDEALAATMRCVEHDGGRGSSARCRFFLTAGAAAN
jgi:hypothetical protein